MSSFQDKANKYIGRFIHFLETLFSSWYNLASVQISFFSYFPLLLISSTSTHLSKILVILELVEMLKMNITMCPLGGIKSKETAGADTNTDSRLEATKITE